jgi:CHAT domain-containing protein
LEQLAKSGDLKQYRVLHFATHGEIDQAVADRCALVLSQEGLPDPLEQARAGKKVYDGKVTMREIYEDWQLDADLVVLSACETGLGQDAGGEGLMGLAHALLAKGARSLVVSLWKVDDTATALLMVRFYENWLGKHGQPMTKAVALREAKRWLRDLTRAEKDKLVEKLPSIERGPQKRQPSMAEAAKPYARPYYWSAFILVGDPE